MRLEKIDWIIESYNNIFYIFSITIFIEKEKSTRNKKSKLTMHGATWSFRRDKLYFNLLSNGLLLDSIQTPL